LPNRLRLERSGSIVIAGSGEQPGLPMVVPMLVPMVVPMVVMAISCCYSSSRTVSNRGLPVIGRALCL
jgi:hypothetical protein